MAIKLKAESWHYKFFHKNFPYSEPPKTLCPYFWILVGLIIAYPFFKLAEGLSSLSDRISKMFPKKEKPQETEEEWLERWDRERTKEKRKEDVMERLGKGCAKRFLKGLSFTSISSKPSPPSAQRRWAEAISPRPLPNQ